MQKLLVLAAFAFGAIALAAYAENPLSPDGPFVVGEEGLEILDTGLLVRDAELDVAALFHSCPDKASKKTKVPKLKKLVKQDLLVTADDIPVAHTPGCGYEEFPPPVLAACNEPLAEDIPDLRGLWVAYQGIGVGHVERIEQCGNRVVITGGGVIHDMRADNTAANGVNDVSVMNCKPIRVSAEFVNGSLDLKVLGFFIAAQRRLDGDELIFTYLGNPNRLVRVCAGAPLPSLP